MTTSSRYCFTINNYTAADERACCDYFAGPRVRYGIYGREIGSSGTPHLQGFLILRSASRRSAVSRALPRAHLEIARGTSVQARDYCKKDGDFHEVGTFPDSQGKRSDLDTLISWCDDFITEHGRAPTSPDIAKHQPHAYLKYPRFRALAAHRAPQRRLEFGEPNDFQRGFLERLGEPFDDRTIDFIVNGAGGAGKTWLCRYLLTNDSRVQILGIGKKSDIAYMVDESKSIFIFNVGRGQMEYLSYALLEALKDRMLMSTKYQGQMKTWATPVFVAVFSNEPPDMTKLTEDRYNIMEI